MRWTCLLVVLVGGCGVQTAFEPSAARVTPAMREACLFALDSEIATKITFFETLREEGVSIFELLLLSSDVCATDDPLGEIICGTDSLCLEGVKSLCNACNAAVLDAVYNR